MTAPTAPISATIIVAVTAPPPPPRGNASAVTAEARSNSKTAKTEQRAFLVMVSPVNERRTDNSQADAPELKQLHLRVVQPPVCIRGRVLPQFRGLCPKFDSIVLTFHVVGGVAAFASSFSFHGSPRSLSCSSVKTRSGVPKRAFVHRALRPLIAVECTSHPGTPIREPNYTRGVEPIDVSGARPRRSRVGKAPHVPLRAFLKAGRAHRLVDRPAQTGGAREEPGVDCCTALGGAACRGASRYDVERPTNVGWSSRSVSTFPSPNNRRHLRGNDDRNFL